MATPLINGRSYAWADVVIEILSQKIIGVKAITYKETQEKTNNFGAGNRPISRGKGRIEAEATITLYMEELEALRRIAPNGNILNLPPFDIGVSYVPDDGNDIVTHKLMNAEFTDDGVEMEEGATSSEYELTLIISHINWRA